MQWRGECVGGVRGLVDASVSYNGGTVDRDAGE